MAAEFRELEVAVSKLKEVIDTLFATTLAGTDETGRSPHDFQRIVINKAFLELDKAVKNAKPEDVRFSYSQRVPVLTAPLGGKLYSDNGTPEHVPPKMIVLPESVDVTPAAQGPPPPAVFSFGRRISGYGCADRQDQEERTPKRQRTSDWE
jgi:hypothetical protein